MKRTKVKSQILSHNGLKNTSTQTENLDSFIEIAKLEEQVKMLQLENNVLRKHAENSNKSNNIVHHFPSSSTPNSKSPAIKTEKSGCSCKGNCSSRICGCMKKSNKCGLSCKCDDEKCQNQKLEEPNQENKENVNSDVETPKTQSRKKNKTAEKTKNNKSLFSPDSMKPYIDFEEGEFSDLYFNFNQGTTKNSQTDSDNIQLKENRQKNDEKQQYSTEKSLFNPRHQLSRTPPNKKLEKQEELKHISPPQSHSEPDQTVFISCIEDQDIKEEKIDWEKHTAELIPCKKCKRTFLPNRIQKHQACCKKI